MLVIKKGTTKEMQVSGFPVAGGLHSQTTRNVTGASVYKGLVPKPVTSPTKVSNCSNSACVYFTYEITVPRVQFSTLSKYSTHKSEWK